MGTRPAQKKRTNATGVSHLLDDEILAAYKDYGNLLRALTRPLLYRLNWTHGEHTQFLLEVIWKGITSYKSEGQSLKSYLITIALKRAKGEYRNWSRGKHQVLNTAMSADQYVTNKDGKQTKPMYQVQCPHSDVFDHVWSTDLLKTMQTYLSPLEAQVLKLYASGYRYKEAAKLLGVTPRSVDNTLVRVRDKVTSVLRAVNADQRITLRRVADSDRYVANH